MRKLMLPELIRSSHHCYSNQSMQRTFCFRFFRVDFLAFFLITATSGAEIYAPARERERKSHAVIGVNPIFLLPFEYSGAFWKILISAAFTYVRTYYTWKCAYLWLPLEGCIESGVRISSSSHLALAVRKGQVKENFPFRSLLGSSCALYVL